MADFIWANGYWNAKFAKFNSLQNFPLYGSEYMYIVHLLYIVYH